MSQAVLWWVESVWVLLVAERGQEWTRPAVRDWSGGELQILSVVWWWEDEMWLIE